jgi:DNA repair protein RadC
MNTKKGHKGEGHRGRLRDRFLVGGLKGFHDYEVVELLLTLGMPRKDCKAAAKAAMETFGSLQGVFEASSKDLCDVPGIGPKNQLGIKLIKAVADRYLEKKIVGRDHLNNSRELFDYLYHTLRDKGRERFVAIFLNTRNEVVTMETMFEGTLTASQVYPREVIQAALKNRAAAVIFAHNHPSGDPEPSKDDLAVTRRLVYACRVMGVQVHEHIVIGENRYFSFADQGYISQFNQDYEKQLRE